MSKDITAKINTLIDHGMTAQQIVDESGIHPNDIRIDLLIHRVWAEKTNAVHTEESFVQNMRTLAAFNQWYEQKIQEIESTPAVEPAKGMATTRQVAFITKLASEGRQVAGQPTEWDDVAKLSKHAASTYIDQLLKSPKVASTDYPARAQAIGASYGVNGGIWDDI